MIAIVRIEKAKGMILSCGCFQVSKLFVMLSIRAARAECPLGFKPFVFDKRACPPFSFLPRNSFQELAGAGKKVRKKMSRIINSTIFAALLLCVLSCRPVSRIGTEVPPERPCERHLTSIGRALSQYKAKHGLLPPPVISDSGGNKASWRMVISSDMIRMCFSLSKQEEKQAVDALEGYHLDEPWDSKKNLQWAEKNPGLELLWRLFFCPTEIEYDQQIGLCPNAGRAIERGENPFAAHYISYLMLVRSDPNTVLPDDAVIVVESLGCGVRVQEPRDILLDELLRAESPFGIGKLNSLHPNVVKALRVDGKVIDISKDIDKEDLRKLLNGTPVKER
jgi:hypothetical protein